MTHGHDKTYEEHPHQHGPGCGHVAIRHGDHVDYVHDGELHNPSGKKVEEHRLEVTEKNPAECRPIEGSRSREHQHGPGCGHEPIPHGDHVDYLVDGRLEHPHEDHVDDHGPVEVVQRKSD